MKNIIGLVLILLSLTACGEENFSDLIVHSETIEFVPNSYGKRSKKKGYKTKKFYNCSEGGRIYLAQTTRNDSLIGQISYFYDENDSLQKEIRNNIDPSKEDQFYFIRYRKGDIEQYKIKIREEYYGFDSPDTLRRREISLYEDSKLISFRRIWYNIDNTISAEVIDSNVYNESNLLVEQRSYKIKNQDTLYTGKFVYLRNQEGDLLRFEKFNENQLDRFKEYEYSDDGTRVDEYYVRQYDNTIEHSKTYYLDKDNQLIIDRTLGSYVTFYEVLIEGPIDNTYEYKNGRLHSMNDPRAGKYTHTYKFCAE